MRVDDCAGSCRTGVIEGIDDMPGKMSIRKEIFALCGAIIVVLIGAIPLFDRHNDAQILMLFFGAFGAGIAFNRLIIKVRNNKQKERTENL